MCFFDLPFPPERHRAGPACEENVMVAASSSLNDALLVQTGLEALVVVAARKVYEDEAHVSRPSSTRRNTGYQFLRALYESGAAALFCLYCRCLWDFLYLSWDPRFENP